MNWVYWLVIIGVLTILEFATVNLVSIWFIASAIIALLISFFIENTLIQFGVFVVFGVLLLITTRPILNKLMKNKYDATNLERIIGAIGIVTEDITKNVVGEVKLDGKRWSAISKEEIYKGEEVRVLRIDGVKLIVERKC